MATDADVFRAVADPTRRHILGLLHGGDHAVKQLQPHVAMSQPALSQHLRVLRSADLVRSVTVGREHRYRLHAQPLSEIDRWVGQYEQFWDDRLEKLSRHLESHR